MSRRPVTLLVDVTRCYVMLAYRIILAIMHQDFEGTHDMHYYNFYCKSKCRCTSNVAHRNKWGLFLTCKGGQWIRHPDLRLKGPLGE